MTSDGDAPKQVIIRLYANPDSQEAIEFFRRLGMCITSWAFVDRRLYQIFHHAMRFEQRQSALIYYRNRGFGQRLRMVDDAVKMALIKDDYKTLWSPLQTETTNLSYTRNILAHQPTLRTGTAKDGKAFDIYAIYIEPYERVLNNEYRGLLGKDRLETEDLVQHEADVAELEGKLSDFASKMRSLRTGSPAG